MTDDRSFLLSLIREGEHQQQDFKYRVADAVKLARSVSAFANTEGGRLLIGVRDDGHLSGVRSEEEIYMLHQAAFRYCRPEASIKFETFHAEGRTIVIATVPRAEQRPVCAVDAEGHRRAYIRIADENIVASPVHLAIWREEQQLRGTAFTYGEQERKLMQSMAAEDAGCSVSYPPATALTLNQIVRRSRLPRHRVVTLLARMVRYGLVQWQLDDHEFRFQLM